MGDLVLTATSVRSRNTALGKALGEGEEIASFLDGRRSVAEGMWTAAALVGMAGRLDVEMPIAAAVDRGRQSRGLDRFHHRRDHGASPQGRGLKRRITTWPTG